MQLMHFRYIIQLFKFIRSDSSLSTAVHEPHEEGQKMKKINCSIIKKP
jgi:hypothetical protein